MTRGQYMASFTLKQGSTIRCNNVGKRDELVECFTSSTGVEFVRGSMGNEPVEHLVINTRGKFMRVDMSNMDAIMGLGAGGDVEWKAKTTIGCNVTTGKMAGHPGRMLECK
jgi:hypothetical protein